MRSIGQNAPISRQFGRYGLGDSDKFLYRSTTSIAHLRVARVIAVKFSKGLEFPENRNWGQTPIVFSKSTLLRFTGLRAREYGGLGPYADGLRPV